METKHFRGFRLITGGQNFRFSMDFTGHRYNSSAATAQRVIHVAYKQLFCCIEVFIVLFARWCHVTTADFDAAAAESDTDTDE